MNKESKKIAIYSAIVGAVVSALISIGYSQYDDKIHTQDQVTIFCKEYNRYFEYNEPILKTIIEHRNLNSLEKYKKFFTSYETLKTIDIRQYDYILLSTHLKDFDRYLDLNDELITLNDELVKYKKEYNDFLVGMATTNQLSATMQFSLEQEKFLLYIVDKTVNIYIEYFDLINELPLINPKIIN